MLLLLPHFSAQASWSSRLTLCWLTGALTAAPFPSLVSSEPSCLTQTLAAAHSPPLLRTGQLEYATDALLADRGFEGRAFPEGRKRYVIPTDEVVANFYQSSKAGQKMTVGGAVRWVTAFVCALLMLHSPRIPLQGQVPPEQA